jgi:hypothetical protein
MLFCFNSSLDLARPHQKWKSSSTQSTSTLDSIEPSSCMLMMSSPPQERTKGGDVAPAVPTYGTVTAKSTRAVSARATAATIWYTLHPKDASRPWEIGRTTRGHHSIHGGRTSESTYKRTEEGHRRWSP